MYTSWFFYYIIILLISLKKEQKMKYIIFIVTLIASNCFAKQNDCNIEDGFPKMLVEVNTYSRQTARSILLVLINKPSLRSTAEYQEKLSQVDDLLKSIKKIDHNESCYVISIERRQQLRSQL